MRTFTIIATTALYLAHGLVSPVRGQGCSSVTDIDGNVYPVVTIGGQCWMAENLKTTRYRDGSIIPDVTDNATWDGLSTGAWCNFNNDPANDIIYGKLYNWYAAADPNICPLGWHVPADAEWTQLTDYLGGESVAGGMMKDTTWGSPNTGATNESGFSGLPGGYRGWNSGIFYNLALSGHWWSASENEPMSAWYRSVERFVTDVSRSTYNKRYGLCIRCLRDASVGMVEEEPVRFTLAPNPAHSIVTLGFAPNTNPRHVALLDAAGRTVAMQQATSGTLMLDLSGLESGVYLVHVQFMDGTRVVEHIVKE